MTRSGTRFVVQAKNGSKDSCETFYFAGANTYYLVSSNDLNAIGHHNVMTYMQNEFHGSTYKKGAADCGFATADDQGCRPSD